MPSVDAALFARGLHQIFDDGVARLLARRIPVNRYLHLVFAAMVLVLDLRRFGHIIVPPALSLPFLSRPIDPHLAKFFRTLDQAALPAGQKKPASFEAAPESGANVHAQAFLDLEPEICDCVRMSYIAAQLVMNGDKAAPFAVAHLYEMLRRFRQEYYAAIWQPSVATRS